MKTVLLGMNNPLSAQARYALYPHPPNCAGWRLWRMLEERCGVTAMDYVEGFDRRNLLRSLEWKPREARAAAEKLLPQLEGRTVIVLGAAVRDALRLPPVLVKPVVDRGVTFRQLPHPSGRCRWYNDPKHRKVAGLLLEEEYERGRRS